MFTGRVVRYHRDVTGRSAPENFPFQTHMAWAVSQPAATHPPSARPGLHLILVTMNHRLVRLGNVAHGIAFVNNIKMKSCRIFFNIPITLNRYENPYVRFR